MSNAKTTADLFRERGWGVGTKVSMQDSHYNPRTVEHVGSDYVVLRDKDGDVDVYRHLDPDDWSLYTSTPPVPTQDEWREFWGKLKAWRNGQYASFLIAAIDAIAAKGDAA